MGQRVHAGRHRQERRKTDCKFRVFDRDLGIMAGWKMIFLPWVASLVMTPARPTSDPVPAVVGTAIIGAIRPHWRGSTSRRRPRNPKPAVSDRP